jgi:hypothetical protein
LLQKNSFDLPDFIPVCNPGGTQFEFFARLPAILTEVLHGIPQSLPMDVRILPGNSSYLHLPFSYLLTVHDHLSTSFDAV